MSIIDYVVVVAYLGFFLFLGFKLQGGQDKTDYFLGSRSFGWFPLALSTMATQLSAVSFISAPAFVGLKSDGGMQWLTYEFAVPFAMLLLMATIMPTIYRSGIVSIYQFIEQRFGVSTRMILSIIFQISRAFATGVMVYALAFMLENLLDIEYWKTIIIIGVITVIYSSKGGMKAVIYGDMIQMGIIILGLLVCMWFALSYIGGWDSFLAQMDRSRLDAVDYSSLGFSGDGFGFFPMLFGGLVLYVSYYGCDQTQVQRAISAKDESTIQKILLANGLLRFPITLLYCVLGLIMGTFVLSSPEFLAKIPEGKPDSMVPIFIRDYLPAGLRGLLIVAIFSAVMSSLSSVINSLTAVTMEDFISKFKSDFSEKSYGFYSRLCAVGWGAIVMMTSFFAGDISDTVIETINKVGSAFYGPIAALFVMGLFLKRTTVIGANIGLIVGVVLNLYIWKAHPEVFWAWWNVVGFVVTSALAIIISLVLPKKDLPSKGDASTANEDGEVFKLHSSITAVPTKYAVLLLGYGVFIIWLSSSLEMFF